MRRLAATSASKVADFEIPVEATRPVDGTRRGKTNGSRQLEDVEAFLSQHVRDQASEQPGSAGLPADPASARAERHDVETERAHRHGG